MSENDMTTITRDKSIKHKSTKDKIAKAIRIITVPPILVTIMIIVLFIRCEYIFDGIFNCIIALIGLGLCPILAYPIQMIISKLREKGRDAQRKLAFICSLMGYFLVFLYGEFAEISPELRLIFRTYFLSVLILTLLNKMFKKRASGHACSITGPLVILSYFIGWKMAITCMAIAVLSFWASLRLKRHRMQDLIGGSITCIASFAVAFCLYNFL